MCPFVLFRGYFFALHRGFIRIYLRSFAANSSCGLQRLLPVTGGGCRLHRVYERSLPGPIRRHGTADISGSSGPVHTVWSDPAEILRWPASALRSRSYILDSPGTPSASAFLPLYGPLA